MLIGFVRVKEICGVTVLSYVPAMLWNTLGMSTYVDVGNKSAINRNI
jgi:hypothetical protein